MTFISYRNLMTMILLFSVATWVQAQQAERAPDEAHYEAPNDPPVHPKDKPTLRSPAMRSIRDGYVSVQVNVDANGNNIVGDAANEPSMAVDPTDPAIKVIGWRQFDSITSDFRQAGYGYTTDGGNTWVFPGVIEPGVFRSDPVLDFDSAGNFYYNSLTKDASFNFWCNVYRSSDGGATWDNGVYAHGGDKQWMCIDRTGLIGDGNIYSAWNRIFSICNGDFTGSRDSGNSYFNCVAMPDSPRWGNMVVGPAGAVYVAGDSGQLVKSSTIQDPNVTPGFDYSVDVNLGGTTVASAGPNPGGLLGQVHVSVDYSDGPTRGNVYLCASVDPSGSDPMDAMFARSTDGGQTWSAPVRINDDSTSNGAWQWFATMSVAPNGRIDVVWNDTRNDPGGYLSELYYSYSVDGGLTWSANVPVSQPFDPHLGWPQQNKIGDYYETISDDLGVDVAYSATFNGEQDVYYLRIGDSVSETGKVYLDKDKYGCQSTAEIRVLDAGLNTDNSAIETVQVAIDSNSETGIEHVLLTETGVNTSRFEGSIDLSLTDAPGVLLIAESDTVTVTYVDADDGNGNFNVNVTDTAVIDCTNPVISNIQVTDIGPFSATVTFESNEECTGTVRYGSSCGTLNETAVGTGLKTAHTILVQGLTSDETTFFEVSARDEAGNQTTADNGGVCYYFTTLDIPFYFTEQFETMQDLSYTRLEFTPNGSADYYCGTATPLTNIPNNPANSTILTLGDDGTELVSLTNGATVSFYGEQYSEFYICSNGFLTFGEENSDFTETIEYHFDVPRIAALFDDLNPTTGGTISWEQLSDRVIVTFNEVDEYSTGSNNTFQIELFFDGTIAINYELIETNDFIAGLSQGLGIPSNFYQTDLSELDNCVVEIPCPWDLDESGIIDAADAQLCQNAWNALDHPADVNENGRVDILDIMEVMAHYGDCPTP
ncbi:MAG: hypothetical protein CR997_01400 [Acidobacteria bacterium]|nr:MAG: hypothetical protein CR997_01400 [Acidobacteriota bacterium]